MTTFLGTKLAKIHFTSHFSEYYCIFARIKNKESHRTMEKAKQILYRAIALDLDAKTLTNHDKVVTPKTREALLKAASEEPSSSLHPVALHTASSRWQNAWNCRSEGAISFPIMVEIS